MLLDILFLGAHHIYNKSSNNYEWYDGWNSCILLDTRNRSTIETRDFSSKRRTGLGKEQVSLPTHPLNYKNSTFRTIKSIAISFVFISCVLSEFITIRIYYTETSRISEI